MQLSSEFDGVDELNRGMKKTLGRLPPNLYNGMVKSCALIEIRMKTHHLAGATLQRREGYLQRSVKSRVTQSGINTSGRVGSPLVYAAIHEYGGIIVAKNALYLVFQIDGKWIRTKQVTIPKREWATKSAKDVQGKIEKIFGRKVEIAIG